MKNRALLWLHNHLFSTWYHTLISVIFIYLLARYVPAILNWLIFKAHFLGAGPEVCTGDGACWVFINKRFNQFMYGFYPRDLQWRINLSYVIAVLNLLACIYAPTGYKKWCVLFLCLVFPCIAYVLYAGGIFGLEPVDTYSWGGLHLTLTVAFASILLSLPISVILALCRKSKMPVLRTAALAFIELWRGVPLISVLFMASLMLPMFFPSELPIDKVLRALIGLTLFYSAYMAEEVRNGLNSVARGQNEAAQALGFSKVARMSLIIVPEALRHSIPGIIDISISLFKDTTLILIIGLFDFLGMIQAANQDPEWLPYGLEGYIFAAFAYWLFSYSMTRYSIHIQHRINLGHRK